MRPVFLTEEGPEQVRFHFLLPRQKVGFTRFILEGYEGLGVQTSSPGSDRVTWTVPVQGRREAETLLHELLRQF